MAGSALTPRELLESVPYPTIGITQQPRVRFANTAACTFFGVTEAEMTGWGPERLLGDRDREYFERHLAAWSSGRPPFPVRWGWEGDTGKREFLVVPFPLPAASSADFVLVFIPSAMVSAALGGRVVESASEARQWIAVLAAEVEALRAADGANGALEARRRADRELATLTAREWEIARRVSEGDRVIALAEDLRISENTVRNHLKAIFRKLGVASQAQLVRRVKALTRRT